MRCAVALVALFVFNIVSTTYATADLTAVGPFSGSISEDFEGFPDFSQSGGYESQPMAVFGGTGMLTTGSGNFLAIWSETDGAQFALGTSGPAAPADGSQGVGINLPTPEMNITFDSPVTAFGGYWGAVTPASAPVTIEFDFFDENDVQIGTTQTVDYTDFGVGLGTLEWGGWTSDSALARVRITSPSYLVGDSFQANAVPEPGTLGLLAMTGLVLLRRRIRQR